MRFYQIVNNIYMEGTVSQIVILGSSFYFVTKKGNFLTFFSTIFLTLHSYIDVVRFLIISRIVFENIK